MEIIYTSRFEKDIQSIDSNVLKKGTFIDN